MRILLSFLLMLSCRTNSPIKNAVQSKYAGIYAMRDAVYMTKFFKMNYKYIKEGRHWYCMDLDTERSKATMYFLDGQKKELSVWSTGKENEMILSDGNKQIQSSLQKRPIEKGNRREDGEIILFSERDADLHNFEEWHRLGFTGMGLFKPPTIQSCLETAKIALFSYTNVLEVIEEAYNQGEDLKRRECLVRYNAGNPKPSDALPPGIYDHCKGFPWGNPDMLKEKDCIIQYGKCTKPIEPDD
ncbi:MAG TPA: hypothetical protein PL048_22385 [Leptospiraceae bacterium]|nr:hypothetical protein [Leptospiraceae bacterium]HMY67824.1 hypothetical protein [Leptospiraceae bacterium]HMZ61537.1 hypothetical protein [Leptospiraceae bacterium]HNF13127.1 hypothetical protein [Leptospiraceae bacterium]HNF23560.1 hypothetical protein [Leptospiraceae bacterium]